MAEVQYKSNVAVFKPTAIMLSMQEAQILKLNTVANNLANATTNGFQSFSLSTEEVVYKTKDNKDISYVKTAALVRDTTNGSLMNTGAPLHAALVGNGYFIVNTPQGTRYTRNGEFLTDTDGKLITTAGHPVLSAGGSEILLPGSLKNISIAQDGTLSSNNTILGKIGVVEFDDEQALVSEGLSLFKTSADAQPSHAPHIVQGSLESSNVSPMVESMRMLELLRLFENAQKVIDEFEQLQKKMINASPQNA
ncbi:MAG: flagellar hook-basal body complex protein [Alphaproteobacteria bacterium]|nr:flagellar hook-basal body complex protein [Alphaproteobacteria bacterium]